jgi:hypothetical protein
LGVIILLASFFLSVAHADLYWESETVSKGIPFQQDGATIQRNYFTSSAYRLEPGDGSVIIIDYNLMKLYTLNPQTRTFTESEMNQMEIPSELFGAGEQLLGWIVGGMGVQVTPTGQTRTISGYNCTRYIVDIAVVHGEYWVTRDIRGYSDLKAAAVKLGTALRENPILGQINIAGIVEKLDGFPVKTTNQIMGGTAVTTLRKIKQLERLTPEFFQVPGDYVLKRHVEKQ